MDSVVFGPRGFDGAGEGEDIFGIEAIVTGGSGGVPMSAGFDGPVSIVAEEGTGIGVIGAATDVFEAPEKGLDAPVVVGIILRAAARARRRSLCGRSSTF